MKPRSLKIRFSSIPSNYKIIIGNDLLASCGEWARKCLGKGVSRIVIVSNPTVYRLYGTRAEESLTAAGFTVGHFLMRDGEQHKTLRTVEGALKSFAEFGLSRTDAVISLGGGVVGDLAGFASSIYLRGLPVLQIPTTLLSMIDSSVGGKTGVNSAFGKNLIGSFHQSAGVLIDADVLRTLPQRELNAGMFEMVKHGAISGRSLLRQTGRLLSAPPLVFSPDPNFRSKISDLILANVAFKAKIVAGDERESAKRTDNKSRKILNFGHTLAHALEKVTGYKYLKHGEAVGYGILFAAQLSKSLALCGEKDVNLLNDVVHRAGALPSLANVDAEAVLAAFSFDKKNLANGLQMVLLKGIGRPVIVNECDIPKQMLRSTLAKILKTSD